MSWLLCFLKMDVFSSSDLVSVVCSSMINTAPLGSWIASGPFASGGVESDFHTNPEADRAHVLWALPSGGSFKGSCVTFREVISFSGPQFSNFYKWMGFLSSTIFSALYYPYTLCINSCLVNQSWGERGEKVKGRIFCRLSCSAKPTFLPLAGSMDLPLLP